MKTNNSAQTFLNIKIEKSHFLVDWGFNILLKNETDGKISCYIPGYDIYFSASDIKMAEKKGYAFTKSFLDNFFVHNKKNSLKFLALELHKRGFKAEKDAMVMKSMVRNIGTNAKFKIKDIRPKEFRNSEEVHHKNKMEVTC